MAAGQRIAVVTRILEANDRVAADNRRLFASHGVRVINLMSSPGAGKTTLLEATIARLRDKYRLAVIAGDIATTRDAQRMARYEIPVVQITTESFGGACHLEASTVSQALEQLDLTQVDLLLIENVGNLVCPAEFDLGEHAKVCVLSVTEGEDKPLKYPLAFRVADQVVISKIDLVPYLRVDMGALRRNVLAIRPGSTLIELSAQSGENLDAWLAWVSGVVREKANALSG